MSNEKKQNNTNSKKKSNNKVNSNTKKVTKKNTKTKEMKSNNTSKKNNPDINKQNKDIKNEVEKVEKKEAKEEIIKEEKPIKKSKKILCLILSIICFLLGVAIILFITFFGFKTSVTLEAGSKEIKISDFYKQGKVIFKTIFVTDIKKIDLKKVGTYDIKLKVNKKVKTIKLNIVDTTPPKVKFKDYYGNLDYELNPEDFIESIDDVSETSINIISKPDITKYGDYQVKLEVKDKYNNKVEATKTLRIAMSRQEVTKELGSLLTKEDILYNVDEAGSYLNQEDIDKINSQGVGDFEVVINVDNIEFKTKIKVQDTKAPELELQNVTIYNDQAEISKEKFIKSCKDASEYTTTLKTEITYKKLGDQEITIEAQDKYGNKVEKKATLSIIEDKQAPVFKGLSYMSVNKYAKINYTYGVSAYDAKDGNVQFSVDSSKVNTNVAGTYYAYYTAVDKAGNKVTSRRQIYVKYDAADRNAKLNAALAKSGRNYESIRQWIMKNVRYNSNNGGSDPIWYGLTSWAGNCIVHAYLYQAMLLKAGYDAKIIYTTDKSHYWCLVKINGKWRHSDATPTYRHEMVSAFTDAERLAHLQGRDWDHSNPNWPEAN